MREKLSKFIAKAKDKWFKFNNFWFQLKMNKIDKNNWVWIFVAISSNVILLFRLWSGEKSTKYSKNLTWFIVRKRFRNGLFRTWIGFLRWRFLRESHLEFKLASRWHFRSTVKIYKILIQCLDYVLVTLDQIWRFGQWNLWFWVNIWKSKSNYPIY